MPTRRAAAVGEQDAPGARGLDAAPVVEAHAARDVDREAVPVDGEIEPPFGSLRLWRSRHHLTTASEMPTNGILGFGRWTLLARNRHQIRRAHGLDAYQILHRTPNDLILCVYVAAKKPERELRRESRGVPVTDALKDNGFRNREHLNESVARRFAVDRDRVHAIF